MRRFGRGQGQADFPTEQPSSCTCARLPAAHAYPCRTRNRQHSSSQGTRESHGLSRPRYRCLRSRPQLIVLAPPNRITRRSDFTRILKQGVRVGRRDVIAHVLVPSQPDLITLGGPRFGLIVGKSVGNSVVRHAVSRRLRAAARGLLADCDPAALIVVRALGGSANCSQPDLERQLSSAVSAAMRRIEATV
ncbi:ribonuclease P protein component [Williamsia limnetica]|uniref:Ribonuclease P protein component n=1 Tax=Williamsia limnetica TaxID=882452 RepID=A0A318RQH7_WILLI|nr:ribonuclease P protein component [Williamsia limnetica]